MHTEHPFRARPPITTSCSRTEREFTPKGATSVADAAPFGVLGRVGRVGGGEREKGSGGARGHPARVLGRVACRGVGEKHGTRIKSVRVDRTGRPNPKGTP